MNEQLAGLRQREAKLVVRAPINGFVGAMASLSDNQWIGRDEPILTLVNSDQLIIEGLVNERYLTSLEHGQVGVFVASSGEGERIPVRVAQIDISAVPALPYAELGSDAGGPIAARLKDDRLIPEAAHYRVEMTLEGPVPEVLRQKREAGVAVIEGKPRSALLHQLQRLIALFIRESGF